MKEEQYKRTCDECIMAINLGTKKREMFLRTSRKEPQKLNCDSLAKFNFLFSYAKYNYEASSIFYLNSYCHKIKKC